jgi:ligand-binding sensor domain-containing protein/class 3 adenylate cyclase
MRVCPRILLFVCCLYAVNCIGQEPDEIQQISCESIGTDQGLSQGYVPAIVQDKEGYLWFATNDGLNKYDGYDFRVFRHEIDKPFSLIENSITSLYYDSKGRLWVGTASGLDLLETSTGKFIHFPQLRVKNVDEIAEDETGSIWITSWRNPSIIDILKPADKNSSNTSFTLINGENFIKTNCGLNITMELEKYPESRAFFENDRRGNFWVCFGSHIYLRRKGLFTEVKGEIRPNNYYFFIPVIDTFKQKTYLLSNYGDIYSYNNGQMALLWNNNQPHKGLGLQFLSAMTDRSGIIWIATFSDTTYRFNPGNKTLYPLKTSCRTANVLSGRALFIDRGGIVWLGTGGYGILKFNTSTRKFFNYTGLPGNTNSIKGLLEDEDGNILVSTWSNTSSPYLFTDTSNKYTRLLLPSAVTKNLAEKNNDFTGSMAQDKDGDYWLSFNDGVGYYRPTQNTIHFINTPYLKLSYNPVIFAGDEIITANDTMLFIIDKATTTISKKIRVPIGVYHTGNRPILSIYEEKVTDSTNKQLRIIWLGTVQGICMLDETTKIWKSFSFHEGDTTSLSNNMVFCLCPDLLNPKKYLWAGTNGGGFDRLDKTNGTFKRYTQQDGLPNNVVYGILGDEAGNMWLSTNKGLSCFNQSSGTFKNFTVDDGLQGAEFNRYAYLKTVVGEMFFGGVNGLNYFYPNDLHWSSTPPYIGFTSFKILNKEVKPDSSNSFIHHFLQSGDTVKLLYNQNTISFEFAALDFAAPLDNHYRYRLRGLESEWVQAGTRHEAYYNNLAPGKYIFEVEGCNSDGVWSSSPSIVTLIVSPRWWRTIWAYCIYLLVAIYFSVRIIRSITYQLRKEKRILKESLKQKELELNQEKQKSENLLLSILPKTIAGEWNQSGKVDTQYFQMVTVLFMGFKKVPTLLGKDDEKKLVTEIKYCIATIDAIIAKNGLEKIKTLNDKYLAVCGLPVIGPEHALKVINTAKEILVFLDERKSTRTPFSLPYFEASFGISSGDVFAGISGGTKFSYEIWGEAVDIAELLQQKSEPGKMTISGSTYELVKHKFKCFHQGKVKAKNKGEIDMYFVES